MIAPQGRLAHSVVAPTRRLAHRLGLPIVAVSLALVVGRAISHGSLVLALAPAAALGVFVLARAPWLPYVALLVAVGSVAEPNAYPQYAFGGVSPFLSELLLGGALIAGVFVLRESRPLSLGEPKTISVALMLVLFGIGVGVIVGLTSGVALVDIFNTMRDWAWFVVFWLALAAVRTPRSREAVFRIAILISFIVVGLQIAQVVVGESKILFYTRSAKTQLTTCPLGQCTDPGAGGFIRVQPPGLTLVYICCAFAGCYLLFGPRRHRVLALATFGVCLTGVLLSLNRNQLLGLGLGLVVATLAVPWKARLLPGIAALVGVVLLLIITAQSGVLRPAEPVFSRFATLGKPAATTESDSLQQRFRENGLALHAIRRQPIEGIGWGVSYGKHLSVLVDGRMHVIDQLFIHNFYLGLWLRTGILGLIGYLIAVISAILCGVRWCRRRRWDERSWLGGGIVASLIAVAASSSVDVGSDPQQIVPLVAVLALAVALGREMRSQHVEELMGRQVPAEVFARHRGSA